MTDDKGVIYISRNGRYYAAPDIDAKTMFDTIQDAYIREQVDKAASKIFNGMYEIQVNDKDGNVVEEATADLAAMVESPKVLLWSRMKQAWVDMVNWGPAIVYPLWSKFGNEYRLVELRRLPPESFIYPPEAGKAIYSEILPGIIPDADGELEFYQVQDADTLKPVLLKKGVVLLKDPASSELVGTSMILPLVPIIAMLSFCWDAQMQKINRVGAPIVFIKLKSPINDGDEAYATEILNNWGKGKSYQLRENMELVALDVSDNEAALATIAELKKRIEAPFRAGSTLDKQGATIGGNASAQKEVEDDWIMGQRAMVEDLFEALLEPWLDANGYEDCSIEIKIAVESSTPGDLERNQALAGFTTGTLTINEIRSKLGASELDDKGLEKLFEERIKLTKAMAGKSVEDPEPEVVPDPLNPDAPAISDNPFNRPLDEVKERAEVSEAVVKINPLDPEAILSHEEIAAFVGVKPRKRGRA